MGMFDSVHVPCPKCGTLLEFQSKAGECVLHDYRLDNAPPEILGDISRDTRRCIWCDHYVGIRVQCIAIPYVR